MNYEESSLRYSGFISYRTAQMPDRALGEELQDLIQDYRPNKELRDQGAPARLKPVFRDLRNLPWTHDLPTEIENALRESDFLLVICSERSRNSEWVEKETEFFARECRPENIVLIWVDGELKDVAPSVLPREIKQLAIDIRGEDIKAQKAYLALGYQRIVAKMLGCPNLEEVTRTETAKIRKEAEDRRKKGALGWAVGMVVAITGSLLWTNFKPLSIPYTHEEIINPRPDQIPSINWVLENNAQPMQDIKSLIRQGADPARMDSVGRNALDRAVEAERYSVVAYLYEHEPRLSLRRFENSPNSLHRAIKTGNQKICKELLTDPTTSEMLLSETGEQGLQPLQLACKESNGMVVAALLQASRNPLQLATRKAASSGMTALHLACERGPGSTAAGALLDFFPNDLHELLTIRDAAGATPVQYACQVNTAALIKMIAMDKLSVADALTIGDNDEAFPMLIAAECANWKPFELISSTYPDAMPVYLNNRHRSNSWNIVCAIASQKDSEEGLIAVLPYIDWRIVLSQSLNVEDGASPLYLATMSGNEQFVSTWLDQVNAEKLSDLGFEKDAILRLLFKAASTRESLLAFLLLSEKQDSAAFLRSTDPDGITLFLRCLNESNGTGAKQLLDAELIPTAELLGKVDGIGNTALHLSVISAISNELSDGFDAVLAESMVAGVDLLSVRNMAGDSVVHDLLRRAPNMRERILYVLNRLNEADTEGLRDILATPANDGQTCLSLAELRGDQEIVRWIDDHDGD